MRETRRRNEIMDNEKRIKIESKFDEIFELLDGETDERLISAVGEIKNSGRILSEILSEILEN